VSVRAVNAVNAVSADQGRAKTSARRRRRSSKNVIEPGLSLSAGEFAPKCPVPFVNTAERLVTSAAVSRRYRIDFWSCGNSGHQTDRTFAGKLVSRKTQTRRDKGIELRHLRRAEVFALPSSAFPAFPVFPAFLAFKPFDKGDRNTEETGVHMNLHVTSCPP
jgi:hypothetical protein